MSCLLRAIPLFQSTPPARGATVGYKPNTNIKGISIHALREGGRRHDNGVVVQGLYFNPRPPRGGRLPFSVAQSGTVEVISIHAPREGGRLDDLDDLFEHGCISIHAPREGGRLFQGRGGKGGTKHFNPRPPRGGRHRGLPALQRHHQISIHAPREGGDIRI